jgi:hypothetical protein
VTPGGDDEPPAAVIDLELLDRLGLRPRLAAWRQRARELADSAGVSAGAG